MKATHLVAVFVCLLSFAACSSTRQETRDDAGETATFHVSKPYDEVFRNFKQWATKCWEGGSSNGAHYRFVDSFEATPGKQGTIDVVVVSPLARKVVISADIAAKSEGTDVTYYVQSMTSTFVNYRPIMEKWANDIENGCGRIA